MYLIDPIKKYFSGFTHCSTGVPGQTKFKRTKFHLNTSPDVLKGVPDPKSGAIHWRVMTPMPVPRRSFTIQRAGCLVFLCGDGFCDIYNLEEDHWTVLENIPPNIGKRPGLALAGTDLLVFGNRQRMGPNVCYSLDITCFHWKSFPTPYRRYEVRMVFAHNSLIYVFTFQVMIFLFIPFKVDSILFLLFSIPTPT